MAGERKHVTVAEVCELIVDCVNKTAPVVDELTPYKMLRTTNIKGGRIDREECRRVAKETFVKWTRRAGVRRGDVILTREAPLGEVGYVDFDDTVFLGQRLMQYRANPALLEPRFLLYSFLSKDLQNQFGAHEGSGSTVSHIRVGDCSKFRLSLPPLAEQKAIAAVLGALDDKIELNRRMNATLEAMARALFQSWFIDFDPVRRNMDRTQNQPSARPSGHPSPSGRRDRDAKFPLPLPLGEGRGEGRLTLDPATAAHFPDSFQDSPIGPVPKGWKVERFHAHITADRGLSYKGEGLRDDRTGLPMHNLNSVYEGGGYKHEGLKYYAGEYREKHLLEPGDMIVTNTEQGFDHLLIGHAAIVPRCYGPKSLFSHHIYRVRHKHTSPFSPHYLVELFNNRRWHYWISGFSNGTTINMLPMDALEMPMLVVPPIELVKKFTALAEAVHIQVEDNKQQSRTLATLRDTLLPKLLSGELSVSELNATEP